MSLRDTPKDESDPSPDLILRPPSPLGRGKKFVSIPLRRGEGGGHAPPGEGSLFGAGLRYTCSRFAVRDLELGIRGPVRGSPRRPFSPARIQTRAMILRTGCRALFDDETKWRDIATGSFTGTK